MDKFYYRDSDSVHLWLHFLFRANHKDTEIIFKGEPFKIKRGQFLSSRNKLSKETGVQESKIERILKCFETEQQIEQLSFRSFRLFTVTNYDKMQNSEQLGEQLVNTDNKGKKGKKGNTTARTRKDSSKLKINFNFFLEKWENITDQDRERWAEAYPACDIKLEILAMAEWLLSNPKKKKSNYRRFVTNWLSRKQDKGGSLASNKPELTEEEKMREHYEKNLKPRR